LIGIIKRRDHAPKMLYTNQYTGRSAVRGAQWVGLPVKETKELGFG